MDKKRFINETNKIIEQDLTPEKLAESLEKLWLKGENKTTGLIAEELRRKIKYAGTEINVLKTIGQTLGKYAKKEFEKFVSLSKILWDQYGIEGRVVTAHLLSLIDESYADKILVVCRKLLQDCITWEECDNMTYAIEPIFRKDPEKHLYKLASWLSDNNKWIKRAALNVIARLPMKQPAYTRQALDMIIPCLDYDDPDVRRTCSFAIRMSTRGDLNTCHDFIKDNIGGENPVKIWILCDAIRSMTKAFLPEFKDLLPLYKKWLEETKDAKSQKSLQAVIEVLEST